MNINELDTLSVWLGIAPMIFVLGMLCQAFAEKRLYSAAGCCFALATFLARIGMLRLANFGDLNLLERPENTFVLTWLGSNICFAISVFFLFACLVWFVADVQAKVRDLERTL